MSAHGIPSELFMGILLTIEAFLETTNWAYNSLSNGKCTSVKKHGLQDALSPEYTSIELESYA